MRKTTWICTLLLSIFFGNPLYAGAQDAAADLQERAEKRVIESLGDGSAIFWASMRAKATATARQMAAIHNVVCEDGFKGAARCYSFLARLDTDQELKKALEISKTLKVNVIVSDRFMHGDGWVTVDVESPTEKILEHLLGEKK